jgi:hypothetical protein
LRPNEYDDRLIIGAVVATLGAQHLKHHPRQAKASSDDWSHHWNRRGLHLVGDLVPGGIGVMLTRLPNLADRQTCRQSDQPGDVVVVGVGGDD